MVPTLNYGRIKIMIKTIATACGWILAIAFLGFWLKDRGAKETLASQLGAAQSAYVLLEQKHAGLQAANDALANRTQPLDLPAPPPPPSVAESERAIHPAPKMATRPLSDEDVANEAIDAKPTPTAEQLAEDAARQTEREKRQEEWAQRREEFRQRMTQGTQDRYHYLSQLDTEGLAPEYAENHVNLLESLALAEQLMANVHAEELSDEEKRELRKKMPELMRGINDMMEVEREILLSDYAAALNLDEKENAEFIQTLQDITEMTTPPRFFGGGRGRR